MQAGGYDIEIIVQGFPGKTVCHGALGWSTVALMRGNGRVALVDTGGFGYRPLLIARLAERGLAPADVTDLLITHAHHDHCLNWTLFGGAGIAVGRAELAWALQQPWGETPVPELYVRELKAWPTTRLVDDGEEVMPAVTAHVVPGHTPGHLAFVLRGGEHDVIFAGDAAKNRAELIGRRADASYDGALSTASIEALWSFWRRRPGSIMVPGHDLPMRQAQGRTSYLGSREATLTAWLGDDLETVTFYKLTA
jgi:glyoxylase-like metal-dependent hydrolase (beta-lactamase superfamily II)